MTDKTPPQAIAVENTLLGSMLLRPEMIERVTEMVPPEAFHNSTNRAIYEQMIELYDGNETPDIINISEALKSINDISAHLSALISETATTTSPESSIQVLNDKYARRLTIELSEALIGQGRNENLSVGEICNTAEMMYERLSNFANKIGIKRRRRGRLVSISDIRKEVEEFYKAGYNQIGMKFKDWPKLSQCYRLVKGTLNVFNGIPGHGKTTFVDAVMVDSIINNGWKWAVFSPENKPYYLHIQPLGEKIIGKPFFADGAMGEGELRIVLDKLQNHIRFIEPDFENRTMTAIKRLALDAINDGGVDGVIIDPWNKVEMTLKPNESETQYVGRTLLDWQYFAREHNIFMGIVAHPTKMIKTPNAKVYPVPTLYNLSGGANWFNGIDNGVTIYRNIEKNYIEVHIQKIKFKNHGHLGIRYFRYNDFNGRLDEISKEETKTPVINPDDFIIDEPETEPELNLEGGHYADEI